MLMGIVLGLLLALAVAVLVNHLDDTFGTIQEIERQLGTSVLTVVYRVGPDEDPLLTSPLGRSSFAEAFRMLRSALRFSAVKRPIDTLVITSPGVGEGKSTVSTNTAIACAEGGQRTIIVDADLRRATLHKVLHLRNNTGLTNCPVNGVNPAEALQDTPYPNLRLLSSGPLPPNPGELLDSDAMRTLIDPQQGGFKPGC